MTKKVAQKARTAVATNENWMTDGLKAISRIRANTKVTGEEIRFRLEEAGIQPNKPNGWGALIRTAKGRKLLEDTGEKAMMTSDKAHSRRTPVYRRSKAKG